MADDVASGVYWHLSSLPDVLGVTGSFPAEEPDNSSVPWTFVRNVYTRMGDVSIVKGSQAVALVCCYMGQGRSRLETSTVRFQRPKIDIWVDPLRDVMGNVTNPPETEHRGLNVYSVLDSHLHRVATDQMTQQWGDLITVGSTRMSEPVWYQVPDGDGPDPWRALLQRRHLRQLRSRHSGRQRGIRLRRGRRRVTVVTVVTERETDEDYLGKSSRPYFNFSYRSSTACLSG
jgi:hypothetical protein